MTSRQLQCFRDGMRKLKHEETEAGRRETMSEGRVLASPEAQPARCVLGNAHAFGT